MGAKKAEFVVVDTTAFIRNAPLQEIADNVITIQEVIDEVKNKRQLKNLIVLPYDLIVMDVFTENIKFITEFSKKTGDYRSLSATDIKVMALAYQLEKEKVGTEHLKTEPVPTTISIGQGLKKKISNKNQTSDVDNSIAVNGSRISNNETEKLEDPVHSNKVSESKEERSKINTDMFGPTDGSEDKLELIKETNISNVEAESLEGNEVTENVKSEVEDSKINSDKVGTTDGSEDKLLRKKDELIKNTDRLNLEAERLEGTEKVPNKNEDSKTDNVEKTDDLQDNARPNNDDLIERFGTMNVEADDLEGNEEFENVLVKIQGNEEETFSEESNESDDEGWITPSNLKEKIKELDRGKYFADKSVKVACITGDFAMQNVLKHIGLNVAAYDGRIIKHVKTFIFRCTTCFKTTSVMTKVFCPNCGHQSLKRVSVSIDKNGRQRIHINMRRPLTNRGKRYSLPTPKGGQHAQYPLLVEDQQRYKSRQTKLAREKNHPMDADYIAGYSPFVMRDVNSKSAVLGVRNGKQEFKYWMRKNPNVVMKQRK